MSPGEAKRAKHGSEEPLVVEVGLSAKRHQDGSIHIHVSGPDHFITTVTDNPKSKLRRHPKLFQALKSRLIDQGRWPFDAETVPSPVLTTLEDAESSVLVELPRTAVTREPVVSRFNPVPVRGEPVSVTIMRDRGSL